MRPTETKSTPDSAILRMVSSVTPPEASVFARPPIAFTASRSCSRCHIVQQNDVRTGVHCLNGLLQCVAFHFDGHSGVRAFLAFCVFDRLCNSARHGHMIVLDQHPSNNPMRWFCAPPKRVAYFDKRRKPGMVLRVSSNVQPVP